MKAIIVTQYHKINNNELFSGIPIGNIKTFDSIPKSFTSLNYNPNQRTDGYHTLGGEYPTLFKDDGFYDVIIPSIDETSEKLGDIYFDIDKFTYNVVNKTQEEIDNYQQEIEDNDNASVFNNNRKADGVILFDRIMSEIERRFLNNDISGQQAKTLESSLYPLIEPLYKGLWRLTKTNLDNTTPPTNATFLIVFNWIKNKVDAYVIDNY